jgi:hypothetical protein
LSCSHPQLAGFQPALEVGTLHVRILITRCLTAVASCLDAAAHGLHMLPRVGVKRLPRMSDFALWATACESAFRPAGTLETAYSNSRRAAIKNIVDADPVAALMREIMADRAQCTGSASDLLASNGLAGQRIPARTRWPTAPGKALSLHPWD